jgi:hypothetical protein
MLNLPDITSRLCTVTMFVIVNIYVVYRFFIYVYNLPPYDVSHAIHYRMKMYIDYLSGNRTERFITANTKACHWI